jgi:hypothetical protein
MPNEFVPFRQRPLRIKLAFIVLWLAVIFSGAVFGLGLGYSLLTGHDMTWLTIKAGCICVPSAVLLLMVLQKV